MTCRSHILHAFAVAAMLAFTAKAQIYVGGQVGLGVASDHSVISVLPEVGYTINDNMSFGAVLGLNSSNWKERSKGTDIILIPYFRYTFLNLGQVKLFADARVDLDFGNSSSYDYIGKKWNDPVSSVAWGIGIAPGIAIPLTDNLSVVGHLGYLGYRYNEFAISADATDLTVGVYYSF